jgi:hypothetical protein
MKVFISWSGELSRQLGSAIREWLPNVLQTVKPYFTPSDIEKGSKWESEISKELEASNFCIIAMTRESLNSHWIPYEAGAISKNIDRSKICPIVFDIQPSDIEGPLTRFQATKFNKAEMEALLTSINASAGDAGVSGGVLSSSFEVWWPKLDKKVREILDAPPPEPHSEQARTMESLLEETLRLTRTIAAQQEGLASRLSSADLYSQIAFENSNRALGIPPALPMTEETLRMIRAPAPPAMSGAANSFLIEIQSSGLDDEKKVRDLLQAYTKKFGSAALLARTPQGLQMLLPLNARAAPISEFRPPWLTAEEFQVRPIGVLDANT